MSSRNSRRRPKTSLNAPGPLDAPRPPTPRPTTLLARGLTRRCAVCGQGRLFRRWFTMMDHCPRCGFRFERREGQFIGVVGMNTVVSGAALLLTIVVAVVVSLPDPEVLPILIAVGAVGVLVPVLFYPFSKTLWNAVDLMILPLEAGEAPGLGAVEGPGEQ